MDPQFWKNVWTEGRTNFHQQDYHEKLLRYFPSLKPQSGQKVLVPLCGKTKDLLWLQDLKLEVHGIELCDQAVEAFFKENDCLNPQCTRDADFTHYTYGTITLSCGDFFKLPADASYDFVYDRAALVALPAQMRGDYARVLTRALKKGAKYLLVVYEYDASFMNGPPFSIDAAEVHRLYGDAFTITLVEGGTPNKEGARLSELGSSLQQKVYILEKIH